jgi:hypothetical protein
MLKVTGGKKHHGIERERKSYKERKGEKHRCK